MEQSSTQNQGATPSDGDKNAYQLQQQPPPPPYFSQSQQAYDAQQPGYPVKGYQPGQPQGYNPPTGQPQGYNPPTGQPQGYNPPTGQPQSYNPPTGQPQSYNPPTEQPQSYNPPTGQTQGYNPPTGQPQGYNPPTGQPQGYAPPTGQPQGYILPPGQYQATVHNPAFPIVSANQESARRSVTRSRCMKVLVTLGAAFLIASLSFYIKAQRYSYYDSDYVTNSVFTTISLVFLIIGLSLLVIGLIGVAMICREERNNPTEGYATVPATTVTVPVAQFPIYATQMPVQEPGTGPSLYPRQQYTTIANHI